MTVPQQQQQTDLMCMPDLIFPNDPSFSTQEIPTEVSSAEGNQDNQQRRDHGNRWLGTRYEAKCSDTFAYYEGYVFDFDETERKLLVAYSWKRDEAVSPNNVRPLPSATNPNWTPKEGDRVECQAKAREDEPHGWWRCVVKAVLGSSGNLYQVTYEHWDELGDVVLPLGMLRPCNDRFVYSL